MCSSDLPTRFGVDEAPRRDEMTDVGDGDPQALGPRAGCARNRVRFGEERVVVIAGRGGIDRDEGQRPQVEATLVPHRDHDWATLRDAALKERKSAPCVPVLATDPLYILYTSGTTGIPKGVMRDNGGHMVALKWSMKNLYDVSPDRKSTRLNSSH